MPESLKKLRIFAAYPSDVVSERGKLETVVESLKPMADYLGLTLKVVDWRAVVPDAGRPQQVIFDKLKPTSWDIFIGILWHRFGTPPGAIDKSGKDFLSGTEEEFKTAYELWKQHGKPRIVIYRCIRALPFDVDPDQLKNVRAFFKLIEDVKGDYPTLYQPFDTTESFEKLVLNNLQKLLIEYGEESKTPITPEVVQVLAPTIPNNLPRRQAFFGRTEQMDIVMRAISPADRTWGVLVDGIGGIGKSAIAIEAAYRAQEASLFEAFVFISAKQNILDPSGIKELNPSARTLDEFLNETARVLGQPGITKLTGDEKRRALINELRSMRTLLIYDNLETLTKEEQEGVANFLRELPQGCKAIITSRRRGGEGGVWLRVEKLDWDASLGIIKNQISLDDGLANKLDRVGEAYWQKLFDEMNGSPLALVHVLGLMRVRAALTFDGALEMLRGNRDEDLQKFIFQEARKELTENDKAALGALSFFVPSATFEAWMDVAGLTRNALETTIDHLSAFSLVDVLTSEERNAMQPLTRVFVRNELLTDAGVKRDAGMQFAQYWVDYAKRYGYESYETYDRLETEWTNLDAAADWLWKTANVQSESIGNKDAARMLDDLVSATENFLWFSKRWDNHVHLCTRSYETLQATQKWHYAGLRAYAVAYVHWARGSMDEAELWASHSADAWYRSASKYEEAAANQLRGEIAQRKGDYAKAEKLMQVSLDIGDKYNYAATVGRALKGLSDLARIQNDYKLAEDHLRKALVLARKNADNYSQLACMENLGELMFDQAEWAGARTWFEHKLKLAEELGRQDAISSAQYHIALVYEAEGHIDLALPLAQEALKTYEQLQRRGLAEVHELVKRLLKAKG